MSPEEIEKGYGLKDTLVWWYDSMLQVFVTDHYWNKEIRCTKLFTDTHTMKSRPMITMTDEEKKKAFENKVYMTITMEAFALWALENNKKKWICEYEFRSVYPNKETHPLPTTEKFQALYTDPKGGQKLYKGWKDEGIRRFNELGAKIKAFRNSEDKVINGEYPKFVKDMLREANGLAENEAVQTKGRGKKRKDPPVASVTMMVFDE